MKKFRFHLLGLAHLPTKSLYTSCAFTQKIVKLARMLKSLGHHVTFYGVAGSDVECDEFVEVVSEETRLRVYGEYDWTKEQFRYNVDDDAHKEFTARATAAIREREQPGDLLLCTMGTHHQPVAGAVQSAVVESGIGYSGIFAKYKVFESYAWMHYLYGRDKVPDGNWYDAVIPNYFDPADYEYRERKSDYFLFLGRVVHRKGISAAVDICRTIGAKLIVAGQPSKEGVDLSDSCVTYVGYADLDKRRELLAGAKALLAPTYYIEPFGGVAIEAAFSGTPVLTTDWGAFTETVLHGVTGYRCRTLEQFTWAVRNIDTIKPLSCQLWALDNFTLDRVADMYQAYFEQLDGLRRAGWYEPNPDRLDLVWLEKPHPFAA